MQSMSSFLLSLIIIFKSYQSAIINKTAYITPNTTNLSDNGATIVELNVDINYDPVEWHLHANNNERFHLQLRLDNTWAFQASTITTLTIKVYADSNTPYSFPGHDLLVAFTQKTVDEYIATSIDFDGQTDHYIYPLCDTKSPYSIGAGNVVQKVNAKSNGNTRWYKATDGNLGEFYNPYTFPAVVTAPLTFILENHPNDALLFTYTNPSVTPRTCGFLYMFPDYEMNVYFAASGLSESVDIAAIEVTISYDADSGGSIIPSIIPSTVPSNYDRTEPTVYPTINPTEYPTNSPTNDPTSNPSENPTIYPTINPTIYPTTNPTKKTTVSPTSKPSSDAPNAIENSLMMTTHIQAMNSTSATVAEGIVADTSTTAYIDNVPVSSETNNNILYVIISVAVAIAILTVVIIVVCTLKRHRTVVMEKQLSVAKLHDDFPIKAENVVTEMAVMEKPDIVSDEGENVTVGMDDGNTTDSVEMITPSSKMNDVLTVKETEGAMYMDDNVDDDIYEEAPPTAKMKDEHDNDGKDIDAEVEEIFGQPDEHRATQITIGSTPRGSIVDEMYMTPDLDHGDV